MHERIFEANALLATQMPVQERALTLAECREVAFDPSYKGKRRQAELVIKRCAITDDELDAARQQIADERERWYPWARRGAKVGLIAAPWTTSLLTHNTVWEVLGAVGSIVVCGVAGAFAAYRSDARDRLNRIKKVKEKNPEYVGPIAELTKISQKHLVFPHTLTPSQRSLAVVDRVLRLRAVADAIYAKWGQQAEPEPTLPLPNQLDRKETLLRPVR